MKYLAILSLLSLVGCATAPQPTTTNKHDLTFTAQSTHVAKRVEWIVVDDIDSACQGFSAVTNGRHYLGCAKFTTTSCKVYTARNTTLSILGHEIRHCFEGHWHK